MSNLPVNNLQISKRNTRLTGTKNGNADARTAVCFLFKNFQTAMILAYFYFQIFSKNAMISAHFSFPKIQRRRNENIVEGNFDCGSICVVRDFEHVFGGGNRPHGNN
jgi:hypothetical protein